MIVADKLNLLFQLIKEDEGSSIGEKWDAFKGAVVGIWELMSMVGNVLGFIGLRVGILLFVTLIFLWFLNTISPLNRKTNYFLGIGVGLYVGIKAKMPFTNPPILIKFLFIVFLPFIITYIMHYSWKTLKWFFSNPKNIENKENINPYYEIDNTKNDPPSM